MPRIIPADMRLAYWSGDNNRIHGHFRPNGSIDVHVLSEGYRANPPPTKWRTPGQDVLSARLFVGFNVGGEPTWTIDDLVQVVRAKRKAQKQKPDSSFITQQGIYTSDETGETVTEKGGQVVILNLWGATPQQFERQMVSLAGHIAFKLKQETVIVEIQRAGIVQVSMGIGASKR